jgi:MFS family permease
MTRFYRTLWLLLACHAAVSLIYSMMAPLLPLYLGELGVGRQSDLQFWSGVSAAAVGVTAALGAPLWGALADRVGKKPLLLRSAFGLVAVLAGFALSRSLGEFIALRFLQGVLIGFQPAAMALMAEQAPADRVGWVVGLFQTGGVAGGVVGPVLGTSLAGLLGAVRPTFWVLTGLAAGISLVVLVFVREERAARARAVGAVAARRGPLRGNPVLVVLLAVIAITTLATGLVDPILPLYLPSLRVAPGGTLFLTGLLYTAPGIATVISAPVLGRLADRQGHRSVLTFCLGGAGLACGLQALAASGWQLVGARFLLGLCLGGLVPVATAGISHALSSAEQGRGFGLSYSANFLGSVLGPLGGGVIASLAGPRWTFVAAAGAVALAGLCLAAGSRTRTQPSQELEDHA